MNVAVMKTKAEQALFETFEAVAGKLPGSAAVKARRAEAIGKFSALGLPHRRIEEWKYTDLRANLKEALPPAIHDKTPLTIARADRGAWSVGARRRLSRRIRQRPTPRRTR